MLLLMDIAGVPCGRWLRGWVCPRREACQSL